MTNRFPFKKQLKTNTKKKRLLGRPIRHPEGDMDFFFFFFFFEKRRKKKQNKTKQNFTTGALKTKQTKKLRC